MKNKIMQVDRDFFAEVDKITMNLNNRLERASGMKFKEPKPITKTLVTRLIIRKIKKVDLMPEMELNLKKFRVRI